MTSSETLRILGHQYIPQGERLENIQAIWNHEIHEHPLWAATFIFNYGVIEGIRQERARRKTQNNITEVKSL